MNSVILKKDPKKIFFEMAVWIILPAAGMIGFYIFFSNMVGFDVFDGLGISIDPDSVIFYLYIIIGIFVSYMIISYSSKLMDRYELYPGMISASEKKFFLFSSEKKIPLANIVKVYSSKGKIMFDLTGMDISSFFIDHIDKVDEWVSYISKLAADHKAKLQYQRTEDLKIQNIMENF